MTETPEEEPTPVAFHCKEEGCEDEQMVVVRPGEELTDRYCKNSHIMHRGERYPKV